jgi:hypothetical protein
VPFRILDCLWDVILLRDKEVVGVFVRFSCAARAGACLQLILFIELIRDRPHLKACLPGVLRLMKQAKVVYIL